MSISQSSVIELAKYPVLVLSIVVGLVVVKHSLGLEFGVVTEVTTDGLKFSEQSNTATVEAMADLETRLNDALARLETLEAGASDGEVDSSLKASWISQAVSDKTAKLAELGSEIEGIEQKKVRGWVWLGNFDKEWSPATLAPLTTGQPVTIAPDTMQTGTEYKVLGNMVLRDGLPPNDELYFRARENLGVVPRGQVVTLLSAPYGVDRGFAVQYWAPVEYAY
jgi:hypothetical protein